MKAIAKLILGVSVLLLSGEIAAETFKCTNADGKITHPGKKAGDLGLKDAGGDRARLNGTPPTPRGARASEPGSPPPPPPVEAPGSAETPAAAAEPAERERRCFVVKTPK